MGQFESKQDFLNYTYKVLPKFKSRELKRDFSGGTKSIFVGEYGYPNVNVGVLSAEEYNHNDDPLFWVRNNWKISEIANSRMELVNSRIKQSVKAPNDIGEMQEVALAKKPTDVEVKLKKTPGKSVNFSSHHKPVGPSADLQNLSLVSNTSIPSIVEKVSGDKDLKSAEGLNKLYSKGLEKDYLVQTLTSGSLGLEDKRKLVPTKWGITAVDDTIGKQIIDEIQDYSPVGNMAYSGSYMGNYFLVLLFEGKFSYELFEFFRDAEKYSTDAENSSGRKKYAFDTAGGYYAARISVLEKLKEKKRQAKALVLRFITDEYYMPLGVWVVRQAVKNAMESKPIEFGSEELMLQYAMTLSKKKFKRDLNFLKQKSKVLTEKTVMDYGI